MEGGRWERREGRGEMGDELHDGEIKKGAGFGMNTN